MRRSILPLNRKCSRHLSSPRCTKVEPSTKVESDSVLTSEQDRIKPFDRVAGPRPLPILGNIWRYFPLIGDYKPETLFENAQFNKKRYGKIVREQLTKEVTILHLFDPEDIESFFRQDSSEPHRRSHRALLKFRRSRPDRYNNGGLFPENGSEWLRLRKMFQHHLLNREKTSKRASIIDQCGLELISTINKLKQSDDDTSTIRIERFEELLQKWVLSCSLAVFLDYRLHDMPDEATLSQIERHLHEELEAIDWTEVKSDRWVRSPSKCPFYQKLAASENYLYDFVKKRIDQIISSPQSNPDVSFVRDWILVEKLNRHDVIAFILDCIMASFHTTVYTTVFLLKNISDCEINLKRKLREEVIEKLPAFHEGLIKDDITTEIVTLRDCLRETLRLNPVSIGSGRVTSRDGMRIGGYSLPRDIMVIAQTQVICRDHEIFERADEFRPERWQYYRRLPRAERPSPFAWLPFGFGPRSCLGRTLASLEICTLVARLLQNFTQFRFENEIKIKTTLIHNIDGHIDVTLEGSDRSIETKLP